MLEVGMKAPDFCHPNQDDNLYCIRSDRGNWVILYFATKSKRHLSRLKYSNFKEHVDFFKKNNVSIMAVIPSSVRALSNFVEKHELDIDLISDPNLIIAKKYEVDYESKIPDFHKGRSFFIIDPEGVIRYIFRDIKVTGDLSDYISRAIREMKKLIKSRK